MLCCPIRRSDYDAGFSVDGKWIVFTSERPLLGQADIYRVHPDGTGLERLTDDPAVDDQGVLSPDGEKLAFVSTRKSPLHHANIWILDLKTKQARNLTGGPEFQSTRPGEPDAFMRPQWSPDGKWIAFLSDRNTEWKGAELGAGRGHFQAFSIYLVHPEGTGLKRLTPESFSAGSPRWSADGTHIVCYKINTDQTSAARASGNSRATSQIATIDIATGDIKEVTSGPGLKVSPQFLPNGQIGYLLKGAPKDSGVAPGLMLVDGTSSIAGSQRNPSWSPDGKTVVYQKTDFKPLPQNHQLYSWDPDREYRYTDVFPTFSSTGRLAITDLGSVMGNPSASISIMDPDGSNRITAYSDRSGAAMMPSWSPDGKSLVFGFGSFFGGRDARPAKLMRVNADGTGVKDLTVGMPNAGFPAWSPDGKRIVYRVWGGPDTRGLRILNLDDNSVKVLTTDWDNFPFWSPSGDKIVFTRQKDVDFDVFVMRPDGTGVKQLTNSPGSDAHATWTEDGSQLFFSSSRAGFKDEAPLYDNSPQPYAQVFMMNADGSGQHQLTDSRWADSMAVYVPQEKRK
jgi:Tol biopolymer transport system component